MDTDEDNNNCRDEGTRRMTTKRTGTRMRTRTATGAKMLLSTQLAPALSHL